MWWHNLDITDVTLASDDQSIKLTRWSSRLVAPNLKTLVIVYIREKRNFWNQWQSLISTLMKMMKRTHIGIFTSKTVQDHRGLAHLKCWKVFVHWFCNILFPGSILDSSPRNFGRYCEPPIPNILKKIHASALFRCASISRTYSGESVGWSVGDSFKL